ncbi:unnamed protein product [Linum trigynum]|uniref:Uncharacterized protein n=1 Tax=Linum trigynum TaxID=586398 RepID=A0AAV2GHC1_9ROSI
MQVVRKSRNQNRKGSANQGNQTARNSDTGKTSTKLGKNPKTEQGNASSSKDRKGKEEQRGEPKKGKVTVQVGKANGSEATLTKESPATSPTQVWRMVGLKSKEASVTPGPQPTGRPGADLTMPDQTELEPTDLNPAHKSSSTDLFLPVKNGPSEPGSAANHQVSKSIRDHHRGNSMSNSHPKKRKETKLRVAKKGHGTRPGMGNGKRAQKKQSSTTHRKAAEDLLDQLLSRPPAETSATNNRENNDPMAEAADLHPTGADGDQEPIAADLVGFGTPPAELAT